MKPLLKKAKNLEEEVARRVLVHFYPTKYMGSILSESPDIITKDGCIGVEVTSSYHPHIQKSIARARHIAGKNSADLTHIDIENIDKKRVYAHLIQSDYHVSATPVMRGDTHNSGAVYKNKTNKLNSNYKKCKENNLYIHVRLIGDEEMLREIEKIKQYAKYLKTKNTDYSFDTVCLFNERTLYEVNMVNFAITKLCLDFDTMYAIVQDALKVC